MRRFWWPEPLYEIKPYGALTLRVFAVLLAAARGWAEAAWDRGFALALLFAVASITYAAAILRMRHRHRSRSRWNRERES